MTQKILMTGIIAAGIFLTSGCESSFESKTESSVEVTSDGVNSSYSSSYKETKSSSEGILSVKIDDANLLDKKTEVQLSFTNNGDKDTVMTGITIKFNAIDKNNKPIREGEATFDNLSIKLPAGKEIHQTFEIEDPKFSAYNDDFSINFDFTDITLN